MYLNEEFFSKLEVLNDVGSTVAANLDGASKTFVQRAGQMEESAEKASLQTHDITGRIGAAAREMAAGGRGLEAHRIGTDKHARCEHNRCIESGRPHPVYLGICTLLVDRCRFGV